MAFYEGYPEFKPNGLYLTAESYGGIYIPMMADQIRKKPIPGVTLKGMAIGDGCWGTSTGLCDFNSGKSHQIRAQFFQGHGMYDQPLWASLQKSCGNWSNEAVAAKDCVNDLAEMNDKVGQYYVYNIYDTCGNDQLHTVAGVNAANAGKRVELGSGASAGQLGGNGAAPAATKAKAKAVGVGADAAATAGPQPQDLSGALNDYPCGAGRGASAWLARDDVAKALHVHPNTTGMAYTWGPASASGNLLPLYAELAQEFQVLIYSGDVDACVPYWGTEEWTRELGFEQTKPWRPWHSPVREGLPPLRAGYVVNYGKGTKDFKYVTVQGAGHMVPQHKPDFALTLFENFIRGKPFK